MRVALEALDDLGVADPVLDALNREVSERAASSSVFAGVNDLRLRLRRAKGALLCVAVVGFAGGGLVTSTATSDSPIDAIVGALDGLPARMDRVQKSHPRPSTSDVANAASNHGAVREEIKRLLQRA